MPRGPARTTTFGYDGDEIIAEVRKGPAALADVESVLRHGTQNFSEIRRRLLPNRGGRSILPDAPRRSSSRLQLGGHPPCAATLSATEGDHGAGGNLTSRRKGLRGRERLTSMRLPMVMPVLMWWIMLIVQYGLGFHAKQASAAVAADASTRPRSAPRQPTASGPRGALANRQPR